MRKFILAAAIAALGAAVVATPAFAFDHHFTVLAKEKSFKRVSQNKFRFTDRLLDPDNRHNKVGRDRGLVGSKHGQNVKVRLRVHLNGKIGGFGDIQVKGDLDPGPDHLVVLGGSDDFNGVAGKLTVRNTKKANTVRYHFDLVR